MRFVLLVVLADVLVSGCSKDDPCTEFVNRSRVVLEKSEASHGRPFTEQDVVTLIGRCHDNQDKAPPQDRATMQCVIAAKDEATIEQCWAKALDAQRL